MELFPTIVISKTIGQRGSPMQKVEDYKKRAQECRTMARNTINEDQKSGLLQMAETWESLARDRTIQIAREKRIDALDDVSAANTIHRPVRGLDRNESA
jgi:hypothetical protein